MISPELYDRSMEWARLVAMFDPEYDSQLLLFAPVEPLKWWDEEKARELARGVSEAAFVIGRQETLTLDSEA